MYLLNDNSMDQPNKEKTSETKVANDDSEKYIQQLSDSEMKTYLIANEHLESSFSVEKSIGYLKWKDQ